MFLLRENVQETDKWVKYAQIFGVGISEIKGLGDVEKVSKLCDHWYHSKPFPVWWELAELLSKCCESWNDDIRRVMRNIHDLHYVNGKENSKSL